MSLIGDNSGGTDIAAQVRDNLAEKFREMAKRAADLASMIERAPATAEDEDTANKLSEAIRQCMTFEKACEGARIDAKAPYLAAERAVDGFFQSMAKPVTATKAALHKIRTAYDMKVEAEQRRKLEEEAAARRAEADRLAAEAASAKQIVDANIAEAKAIEAAEFRNVKAADLTRTRTTTGVVTSLKKRWVHTIVAAAKVPRKFCSPDDALIRAAIKAATQPDGSCPLTIPGTNIYQEATSQVR